MTVTALTPSGASHDRPTHGSNNNNNATAGQAPARADDLVLEVLNATEPDEPLRFEEEGRSALFGRDDDVCDLVVWSAINGRDLSRVAGRIWRMDGRLWVQNLSGHHELVVMSVGESVEVLPPRHSECAGGPGRSLPWGSSVILGPGGCELHITQDRVETRRPVPIDDQQTEGLPSIPSELMRVALALCEPLLRGSSVPATYRQVSDRAGLASYKRARSLVAELCEIFWSALPEGVLPDPDAQSDSPMLKMPDYLPVAQLLVRRRLVRADQLVLLDAQPSQPSQPSASSQAVPTAPSGIGDLAEPSDPAADLARALRVVSR